MFKEPGRPKSFNPKGEEAILQQLLALVPRQIEATGEEPLLLRLRGLELRLHCPGETGVERALQALNCLRGELPLLVTRQCYTRSNYPGEPLASKIYHLVVIGDLEQAESLMESAGAVTGIIHAKLEKCPSKPAACQDIVGERLELARRAGLPHSLETPVVIPDWCSRAGIGHGDLHLYQFIASSDRLEITDFSGEPDTRTHTPQCYDIATVARSLDYIASIIELTTGERCNCTRDLFRAFLEGYMDVRDPPPAECLEACCIARAYYEYYYEKTRSTGLEWIPERALKRVSTSSCVWGTG